MGGGKGGLRKACRSGCGHRSSSEGLGGGGGCERCGWSRGLRVASRATPRAPRRRRQPNAAVRRAADVAEARARARAHWARARAFQVVEALGRACSMPARGIRHLLHIISQLLQPIFQGVQAPPCFSSIFSQLGAQVVSQPLLACTGIRCRGPCGTAEHNLLAMQSPRQPLACLLEDPQPLGRLCLNDSLIADITQCRLAVAAELRGECRNLGLEFHEAVLRIGGGRANHLLHLGGNLLKTSLNQAHSARGSIRLRRHWTGHGSAAERGAADLVLSRLQRRKAMRGERFVHLVVTYGVQRGPPEAADIRGQLLQLLLERSQHRLHGVGVHRLRCGHLLKLLAHVA
mmetsp:Transcript_35679/g.95121  ORF Transcript_35679/g.95121 Transcript_35679/m.95121 type:complete len:345 (-) Transcript_35679:141-1175(-)